MKKLVAIIMSLLLALSVTACSSHQSVNENSTENIRGEIKENIDNVLEKNEFEGIVYLTQNGTVVYQSATGTDESGADLTVDTTMYIGSISKQICAAAVLMLRDQGKLSLDDTLDTYYPEYKKGKKITLKNLLSMRSGIPDMVNNVENISADKTDEENTAAIMEWIFSMPLDFEPDSSCAYCNSNYFLLSNIVEQVSGQNYSDFIKKEIFKPLGMTHSGFINDVKDSPDWASGLTYDTFTAGEASPGLTKGAGDIASNAQDMEKWMTALSSGKVISPESYREMTTNYSPDSTKEYGYGMFVSFHEGVGHSGLIGSYRTVNYINEEHGYHLFIANNTNYNAIENLPDKLLCDLLDE